MVDAMVHPMWWWWSESWWSHVWKIWWYIDDGHCKTRVSDWKPTCYTCVSSTLYTWWDVASWWCQNVLLLLVLLLTWLIHVRECAQADCQSTCNEPHTVIWLQLQCFSTMTMQWTDTVKCSMKCLYLTHISSTLYLVHTLITHTPKYLHLLPLGFRTMHPIRV